jgi:enterochelin esterase-like enzyme
MKSTRISSCVMFALSAVLSAASPCAGQQAHVNLDWAPQKNLFVGLGTHENQPTNRSVVFHQILEKRGIAHDDYVGGDGGHDWGTWRAHLVYMLPKLWRKRTP